MIIQNEIIQNPVIKVNIDYLDFSKFGIYLLQGENGTGKTTLLHHIVFNDMNIFFKNESHQKAYQNDRKSLIAYVPQMIDSSGGSVQDYIVRDHPNILLKNISLYEQFIGVDLKSKFQKLSGGEKMRCAIVSAILKNTPYIILDEPTNHLDNDYVDMFCTIINELAKTRTIIISSHDPRLSLTINSIYKIENYEIIEKRINDSTVNNREIDPFTMPKYSIFKALFKSNLVLYTFALIFAFLGNIVYQNEIFYQGNIATEYLEEHDSIFCYGIGEYIDDLTTGFYIDNKGLSIEEYQGIYPENLQDIKNMDGIKEVYLVDVDYIGSVYEKKNNIICVPKSLFTNYKRPSRLSWIDLEIREGRYPEDGQNEIMLSNHLIKQLDSSIDINNAIGKSITLNSKEYLIVGICKQDYYILSFSKELLGYGIKNDEIFESYDLEMLITCDENDEERITDELMVNYPYQCYDSYTYGKLWNHYHNLNAIIQLSKIIVPLTLIFFILFTIMQIYILKLNHSIYLFYLNYYFDHQMIQIKILESTLFSILAPALMIMIGILIFSNFKMYQFIYILASMLIMIIITMIIHRNYLLKTKD